MRSVPADIARKLVTATGQLSANFEDLRMDDIAQASGVPRATLYYHFAGKDDVLSFLHEALLEEFRANVRAPDEGDARARLTELITRQLTHIAGHPAVTQLLVLNLGRLGKFSELASSRSHPVVEPFHQILEAGVASGELRAIDVEAVAIALSDAVHAIGLRSVAADRLDDARALAERFVDVLWHGIGPPASSP
jgi:TetR/AcrR family transcriptional regulator